jgi:hypothetical protein
VHAVARGFREGITAKSVETRCWKSQLIVLAMRLVTPVETSEVFSAWPRRLWLSCRDHRSE